MASVAPSSPVAPVPVQDTERKHVIVVGAGVIGLCSALWLLRTGHRVTIVDRLPPMPGRSYEHACSYGNASTFAPHGCVPVATPGIAFRVPGLLMNADGPLAICWQYLPHLMPWLLKFVLASRPAEVERIAAVLGRLLALADQGVSPLIEEANASSLMRHTGCLYLYKNAGQYRAAEAEIALRQRHGVRMDFIDAGQIHDLEPHLAPLYHRGVLFKDAYTIDTPHQFALALAAAIRARGGEFMQGEVDQVRSAQDSVEVQLGDKRLSADRVVVAGGAWSKKITQQIGDRVLLDTERGYHVFYPEAEALLSRPVCYTEHGFYMTPVGGGVRAAGTVELGGVQRPLNAARTQRIARVAKTLLPGLHGPTSEWLGFRPSMPDSLPVIGPSPRDPRIIYAFGHGHLGLTLAGITGCLVAGLVGGHRSPMDLTSLRPDRFGVF